MNNTKSILPSHIQPFKQKLLSGNGFVENKRFVNWFHTLQTSLEDFQLLNNEPFDNSITKRDF